MRIVAIALIALVVAAASPAHADKLHAKDECDDKVYVPGETGMSCLRIEMPEPAATATQEDTGGRLFVWMGDQDAKESTSVVTGTAAILGAIYADSNGYPGLQRHAGLYGQKMRQADHVVLI